MRPPPGCARLRDAPASQIRILTFKNTMLFKTFHVFSQKAQLFQHFWHLGAPSHPPPGRLHMPPDASRCLQKPPDASRCLQTPPDASRCLQTPSDVSRCLQRPPGASGCLEMPRSPREAGRPSGEQPFNCYLCVPPLSYGPVRGNTHTLT